MWVCECVCVWGVCVCVGVCLISCKIFIYVKDILK